MKSNLWNCSDLSCSFLQVKSNIIFFLPQTSVFEALSTKAIHAWLVLVIPYIWNTPTSYHSLQMRKEPVPFLGTVCHLVCHWVHWRQHIYDLACLYLLLQRKCEITCSNYFKLYCEPKNSNSSWIILRGKLAKCINTSMEILITSFQLMCTDAWFSDVNGRDKCLARFWAATKIKALLA